MIDNAICSVAAIKDGKVLGQFPVVDGSNHAQRMAAILEDRNITDFDFYILPHSISYPDSNGAYLGMKPDGKSWIWLHPETFEVVREYPIPTNIC